jgi:hypothetical protein
MQQFKGGTGINHQFIGWVATCTNETPETKRRSQPFATSKHQPRNFINWRDKVYVYLRPALALYGKQCLKACIYARGNI